MVAKLDETEKSIDVLMADFQSLKSEIGRRSNLQRFYLGLFLGALGLIALSIIDKDQSSGKCLFSFPISLLFLIIYKREDFDIHRLGEIIVKKISEPLNERLHPNWELIPSETYRGTEKKRKSCLYTDLISLWMLFFIGPLVLTGLTLISAFLGEDKKVYEAFNMDQVLFYLILCCAALSLLGVLIILVKYFPYELNKKGNPMGEKLDEKELVSFEELLRANMIQTDAVAQLLIEKGLITEQEFFTKLKQVQHDYESKRGTRI